MVSKKIFQAALFVILPLFLFSLGCNLFPSDSDSELPLKEATNQADYLIVSPTDFMSDLKPFIDFKETEGLNVKSVNLDNIYDEFPIDSSKAESIRDFISYALQFWQEPKPKYVLLVGDTDIIPTFRLPSSFAGLPSGSTTVEENFVFLDEPYSINKNEDDNIPDVALGRLPVDSPAALINLVNKTIMFENTSPQNYPSELVMLVDEAENISDFFEVWADELIAGPLSDINGLQRIDIREGSELHGNKNHLFERLDAGSFLFSFMGFGSATSWTKSEFLVVADIDVLNDTQKPFVAIIFAGSQTFHVSNETSIIEKMLHIQSGGAVATIAPSGLTWGSQLRVFSFEFFGNLMSKETIGDVFLTTKQKLISELGDMDRSEHTFRRFNLLGDPSLSVKF